MNPIIIKIGGALLDAPDELDAFWEEVCTLQREAPVVLVHGGGNRATALAERLGHTPDVVQGRRITSDLDLKTVHWSLCGAVNTELVAQAGQRGLTAVGLTGADGHTLRVKKRPPWQIDGEQVDFGWVGDVIGVETDLLETLLVSGVLPVVAPLGIDAEGRTYNVNADTVACALAKALEAAELLLVTQSGGVRREAERAASHLDTCDSDTFQDGIKDGWIGGGMRVKLRTAFDTLEGGVPQVYILAPGDLVQRERATQVVEKGSVG